MAQLTEIVESPNGAVVTLVAVAAGDYFVPSSRGSAARYILHVKNGSGSSTNVTVNDPNTPSPIGATAFNPNMVVAVGAGVEKHILLDNVERFVDSATGRVNLTYSATATVTIAVFRVI